MHTVSSPRVYPRAALEAEGFSRAMIRKYIYLGVLPRAIGRGKSAYYTDVHLATLREIRRRRESALSLADVREWRRRAFKETP